MNTQPFGTGGFESEKDVRTVQHDNVQSTGEIYVKGGSHYKTDQILHQHRVGICTAISRVQMRQKQTGKKYSYDFQYLLQKKFIDGGWWEGSSVLSSNKVAKKYGFLPASEWTHTTESDLFLPYEQYIAKLKAIPDVEIYRLISKCIDPIAGYAQVNVRDPQAIAKAIMESPEQSGILCRYGCQKNWWTPSWKARDINPLRNGQETSGHAIINNYFDYSKDYMQILSNTWGTEWCNNGCADINWSNYPMTEAWVDLLKAPEPVITFTRTLKFGMSGDDVSLLQTLLKAKGYFAKTETITKFFGTKTLAATKAFQKAAGLVVDGKVGVKTQTALLK